MIYQRQAPGYIIHIFCDKTTQHSLYCVVFIVRSSGHAPVSKVPLQNIIALCHVSCHSCHIQAALVYLKLPPEMRICALY